VNLYIIFNNLYTKTNSFYFKGYPNNRPKQIFSSLQQAIRHHMIPTFTQLKSYLANKKRKQKKQITEISEIQEEDEYRNETGSEEEQVIILEDIQSKSTDDSNESYFAYCISGYSESSSSIEAL